MTTVIHATYRAVTPLFCGGAHHEAELRLPSFKGVLRFWWRALAWRDVRGNLEQLRESEEKVFGSAKRGQSRVNLRLVDLKDAGSRAQGDVLLRTDGRAEVGGGARYLGYGLMEAFASRNRNTRSGQLLRPCRLPGLEFAVALRCRGLSEENLERLGKALKCLGTLGGLGARSRRGYGSLALLSLTRDGRPLWQAPADLRGLSTEVTGFLGGPAELPEYTAFSGRSRIVLLSSEPNDPLHLLDLLGKEMLRFRSWGHHGQVLGQASERRFRDDHDLMKLPLEERHRHPRRIVFGLPHNYGKPTQMQVGPADEALDRRASPLFLHIHPAGVRPIAVVTLLPARFLPVDRSDISVGHRIVAGRADPQAVPLTSERELFAPLHQFLDRLLDPDQRKEAFTEAREVGS